MSCASEGVELRSALPVELKPYTGFPELHSTPHQSELSRLWRRPNNGLDKVAKEEHSRKVAIKSYMPDSQRHTARMVILGAPHMAHVCSFTMVNASKLYCSVSNSDYGRV